MKNLLIACLLLSFGVSGLQARAAKMDSETQDQVIARLERVLSLMEKNESAWIGTNLRLADLLSERARLRFMAEVEAKCEGCKGSVTDRKRSISLYEGVLDQVKKEDRGQVLFQLAHLYDMAGGQDKSQSLFEKILTAKKGLYDADLITRAEVGLADILFQKGKNKEALVHYQIAFKDKNAENRGLILYRIAWCEFNQDHLPAAIATLEKLMASPELLTKEGSKGSEYDSAFHCDVSRDLATFYSRRKIADGDIAKYKQLIPKDQRKVLLVYFADEASRIGQKAAAYQIYQSYLEEPTLTKSERLAGFVHLAQTRYEMGQSTQSTDDFAVAAMNFKDMSCNDKESCAETQKNMRRYVTDLHRANKVHPTMDVLKAYFIYVKTFPEDAEMAILGAQLAMDLKQESMALTMYQSAVNSNVEKYREAALLGEIEAAERMKNLKDLETAYKNYLAVIPKGEKAFVVRYQLAQLAADRKDWSKAAQSFHDLALDPSGTKDLRKKSADLALDSLAAEKRDLEIQTYAAEFATAFPEDSDEFRRIARKATMNQVVQTANSDRSSKSDLQAALQQLQKADLRGATPAEKLLHYKNASVLAQKAGDDATLMAALNAMLSVKTLSASEREETLARKVGIFERHLDFKSALSTAQQMKFPGLRRGEKELRLGTLTDLAGLDPRAHYQAALQAGLPAAESASVRSRLVLIAKDPISELKRQKELARDSALMSETLLVVYARTKDSHRLAPFLKDPHLSRTQAVRFITKQPFYTESKVFDRRIQGMKLQTHNDTLLQRSIKERIKALNQADQLLKAAVSTNDFTAQVMALTIVSRENDRFTLDLLTLPLPKKLSPAEQKQYTALLRQQGKPYFAKAKAAQGKLQEFWNNDGALSSLISEYSNSRREVRAILENELHILMSLSPSASTRHRLQSALQEPEPTAQELLAAREAVRQNPNDLKTLEKLKILETKMGHLVMASYLEARLGQIHKGEI